MLERLRRLHLFDELRVFRIYNATAHRFNRKSSLREFIIRRECLNKYNWGADEFFLYNYESLTEKERISIVSDVEQSNFAESVNSTSAKELLSDKWKTFKFYKDFFKREACIVAPIDSAAHVCGVCGGGV